MRCGWPNPVRACRFRTLNAEPTEVFTLRRCALLAAILVLIAALRIVSTYTELSHTVDEPIHLAAGMEWLDHGTMTGDVSHPPMARVLSAVGPWLAGARGRRLGSRQPSGTWLGPMTDCSRDRLRGTRKGGAGWVFVCPLRDS